jgi:hypothetical protein
MVAATFAAGAQAVAAEKQIPTPVATYKMNELPRQTVLHDSAENRLHGIIGNKIERNGRYFHFTKVPRDHPLDVERTARVYSDDLNPGDQNFAITWKQRTTKKLLSANVVQKGQGSPAGGMFKIKNGMHGNPWLRVSCFWRGSNGGAFTESTPGMDFRDGKWHIIRCARIAGVGVVMRVDGVIVDRDSDPGMIANSWPVSIGGNSTNCEDVGTDRRHCNYWAGDLAWMRFTR